MNTNNGHVAPDARSSQASETSETNEIGALAAQLRSEFERAWCALRSSLLAERRALGLTLFDAAFRLWTYAAIGVAIMALAVAAVIVLVLGARQGLQSLSGGAWWGDVLLACGLILMCAVTAFVVRRRVHRSTLTRTRKEIAAMHKAATPAGDGA